MLTLPPRLSARAGLVPLRPPRPADDAGSRPGSIRSTRRWRSARWPAGCCPTTSTGRSSASTPPGMPLGQLCTMGSADAVVCEGAPGRPGPIGGRPTRAATPPPATSPASRSAWSRRRRGPHEPTASAGRDPAVGAAARDRHHAVDGRPVRLARHETVAGLIGRPIALVRALLRLEVDDDLDELAFAAAPTRRAAGAFRRAGGPGVHGPGRRADPRRRRPARLLSTTTTCAFHVVGAGVRDRRAPPGGWRASWRLRRAARRSRRRRTDHPSLPRRTAPRSGARRAHRPADAAAGPRAASPRDLRHLPRKSLRCAAGSTRRSTGSRPRSASARCSVRPGEDPRSRARRRAAVHATDPAVDVARRPDRRREPIGAAA